MRLLSRNCSLIQTDIPHSDRIYWSEELPLHRQAWCDASCLNILNMFTVSELVVLLAVLSATASGYFVSIDAHAEECFYERVNSGTKMGLMFEVAEGGFLDIDVEVKYFSKITNRTPNMKELMCVILIKTCWRSC